MFSAWAGRRMWSLDAPPRARQTGLIKQKGEEGLCFWNVAVCGAGDDTLGGRSSPVFRVWSQAGTVSREPQGAKTHKSPDLPRRVLQGGGSGRQQQAKNKHRNNKHDQHHWDNLKLMSYWAAWRLQLVWVHNQHQSPFVLMSLSLCQFPFFLY